MDNNSNLLVFDQPLTINLNPEIFSAMVQDLRLILISSSAKQLSELDMTTIVGVTQKKTPPLKESAIDLLERFQRTFDLKINH